MYVSLLFWTHSHTTSRVTVGSDLPDLDYPDALPSSADRCDPRSGSESSSLGMCMYCLEELKLSLYKL